MTLYKQFDAAFPPGSIPPGCQLAAGYIGRPGFTPHVWTPEEWQPFKNIRQIPIWVPDLTASPDSEAIAACEAAEKLGWHKRISPIRTIVFDLETAEVPGWYQALAAQVTYQGFVACAYGSLSTVLKNGPLVTWSADWDGIFQIDQGGPTIEASQFSADQPFENTQVDYSACSQWWFNHAGEGARWINGEPPVG